MSDASLNNYLKNIEDVMKAELERVQSFYPSDVAIHPDFINDIREITMNRYLFLNCFVSSTSVYLVGMNFQSESSLQML